MTTPQDKDWNRFWDRKQSDRFGKVSWSKKRIMDVLEPFAVEGKTALDAGCGSGFFSQYFLSRGMKVLSLDYSLTALERAKESTSGQARMVQADMLNDDLRDKLGEKVDLIFSDGLLEHFPVGQQDKIIRNLSGQLNPGGVIVTFVPNKWSPWEIIRPFYMPGIDEKPFVLKELVLLNARNDLNVVRAGGVNTLPFRFSPEGVVASRFGMLLYTVAHQKGDD